MKADSHGGNIYKKAKELGIPESQILDFSANISPLGLPDHIRQAMVDAIDGTINYPDPDCMELREELAKLHGIKLDAITCGNGGADLLYRLGFGLKPKKVLLPVPAFVEYEEALTSAGAEMDYYRMETDFTIKEDFLDKITAETDLVIICNPNNPTGILTPKDLILKVVERAKAYGAFVMIDECFLEIYKDEAAYSVIPSIYEYENLIILKSFTKLYAIPGVRLGYLISSNEAVIEKVNHAGQAWSVSYLAQQAGLSALKKPEYKAAVIKEVEKELSFLKKELSALPIQLYDGNVNYLFFRTPELTDLDKQMEQKGILIRNCSNYVNLGRGYWRVAVRNHEENIRLVEALRSSLL